MPDTMDLMAGSTCRLCGRRIAASEARTLVRARQEQSWDSILFLPSERASISVLRRLGTALNTELHFRESVDLCSPCLDGRFAPEARDHVREKAGLLDDRVTAGSGLDSDFGGALTNLVGLCELGFQEAFPPIIRASRGVREKKLYYPLIHDEVLAAGEALVKSGRLERRQLDEGELKSIAASLESRIRFVADTAYSWARLLDTATLLASAQLVPWKQVLTQAEQWDKAAQRYLKTGDEQGSSWGADGDVGKVNAEAVLESARTLRERAASKAG